MHLTRAALRQLSLGVFIIMMSALSGAQSSDKIDACVDKWMNAYRQEPGMEDAIVTIDQIQEWEIWCKHGKVPTSHSKKSRNPKIIKKGKDGTIYYSDGTSFNPADVE